MLVRMRFRSTFSLVAQLARKSIEEASRPKSLQALAEEQLRSVAKWPTQTNKLTVKQTDGLKGERVNPSFVIVFAPFGSPNPADLVSAPLGPLWLAGRCPKGAAGGAWRRSARSEGGRDRWPQAD